MTFTGGVDDTFLTPDSGAQPPRYKADTDSATIKTTAILIRLLILPPNYRKRLDTSILCVYSTAHQIKTLYRQSGLNGLGYDMYV